MSAIITRELVRRYLRATGQTADELRALELVTGVEALDGFLIDFAIDRATLGMLAAAEMLYARAPFSLRNEVDRLVKKAGVDPKAWEAAR